MFSVTMSRAGAKWCASVLAAAVFVALAIAVSGWLGRTDASAPPSLRGADGGGDGSPAPSGDESSLPAERRAAAGPAAAADGAIVRGRVLDGYGEPVAAVLVGEIGAATPVATERDGTFGLPVAPGPRRATLLLLAPQFAPAWVEHELPAGTGERTLGDVELQRGGELRGLVTDGDARPLAGVEVALEALTPWPAGVDPNDLLPPQASDADGGYTFAHLVPGSYRVRARAAGRPPARSGSLDVRGGEVTTAEPLVLPLGLRLAGVVLAPDGQPVSGAVVLARARAGAVRYDGETTSDGDGRFAFDDLPAATLAVSAEHAGFQRWQQDGVDPTRGEALIVRLVAGLAIRGSVVDARTGQPVEAFAVAVRRVGELAPQQNGTIAQQLARRVDQLRRDAAAGPGAAGTTAARLADEFAARLARLEQERGASPVVERDDVGPVEHHAGGAFAVGGLEPGLYAVTVASPAHQLAAQQPIAVANGAPAPTVSFAIVAGAQVAGVVVAAGDAGPVAGADVELVRVDGVAGDPAEDADGLRSSLAPWLFGEGAPRGAVVRATSTGGDGRFVFPHAAPGRYVVTVRHARFADHHAAPFVVTGDGVDVHCELAPRGALSGRVLGVTPALAGGASVLVVGGHGVLRTVRAAADGTYACELLPPGSYIVRAFATDDARYVARLFGEWFPLHAGAFVADRVPPRDVVLAPGETRALDVPLDVPATGRVDGFVAIDGQPGPRCSVQLRPVPGEAPGSGGLSLRSATGDGGRFVFDAVPAGSFSLSVRSPSGQELHREQVTVAPDAPRTLQLDLAAGGLRGRVVAPDGAVPSELRGYVWLLPGADAAPADLYEYRKEHRVHRLPVRDGTFADAWLTPGPAVVVVDLRGRAPAVARVTVPPAGETAADFTAGAVR